MSKNITRVSLHLLRPCKRTDRTVPGICHDPCSLKRVEVDVFPCEQLLKCAAFKESRNPNKCSVCGHRWDIHLHITWKSVEKNVQVEDKAVVKRRKQNQSDVEIIRQALESRQALIEQYDQEREIIQKAASKFAVFLKHSAVKPWNDSKLAYLDHLIREVSFLPTSSIY